MYAAEIEKGHIEVHGGDQMFVRLAETEAQARKATQLRSDAEIGAFDLRCAYPFNLGVSADWDRHDGLYGRSGLQLRPHAPSLSAVGRLALRG